MVSILLVSFDNVVATKRSGWSVIRRREVVESISPRTAVAEFEALLIKILGIKDQNQMQFIGGTPWEQVTLADCQPRHALSKVDPYPLVQPEFKRALVELGNAANQVVKPS